MKYDLLTSYMEKVEIHTVKIILILNNINMKKIESTYQSFQSHFYRCL